MQLHGKTKRMKCLENDLCSFGATCFRSIIIPDRFSNLQ